MEKTINLVEENITTKPGIIESELKTKDVVRIQEAMTTYDQELQNSINSLDSLRV